MSVTLASHVSARVEGLIERHHGGDRRAAARRLGIEADRLTGLLSGDWRRFSLDALAALVRGYGVSVDWLLAAGGGVRTGRGEDARQTPAGTRGTTRRRPAARTGGRGRTTRITQGGTPMAETKRIPQDQLESYFDALSKRIVPANAPEVVDVDVASPDLGDQIAVQGARLEGVSYDPRANTFELFLESGDHRVYTPKEVWVIEDADGFVRSIEVVRDDGTREIVSVKRVGLQRVD